MRDTVRIYPRHGVFAFSGHVDPPHSCRSVIGRIRYIIVLTFRPRQLDRRFHIGGSFFSGADKSLGLDSDCRRVSRHHQPQCRSLLRITAARHLPLEAAPVSVDHHINTVHTGKGIRFGSCGQDTVDQLVWLEKVLGPALKDVVHTMGGINLKMIISQALAMGDELHMRNNAATNLFVKTIAETLCEVVESRAALTQIMHFLTWNNDQFFLNFAMAANKACADAAHGIEHSTMVTAMARNGVNIGIRVSGLGDRWFTAPAADVAGAYFPGYSAEDANKDIGDSAIMETGGIGGMAIATAPAIVRFLGAGKYQDAVNYTNNMYEITLSEQDQYAMPDMDFRGSPIGIDILKVVETGISPIINTAIACKRPGVGMIGAGISKAPLEMFEEAMVAFGEAHGLQ